MSAPGILTALLVALGGGVGAVVRYALDRWVTAAVGRGRVGGFPWGITLVNLSGSLVLGVLVGLGLDASEATAVLWVALGVGVLGGYTTFSTASLDTVRLARERRHWAALGNAVGTLGAAVALAIAGIAIGAAIG